MAKQEAIRTQNALQALALQQGQQGMADDQAARAAFAVGGGDQQKVIADLYRRGLGGQAMKIEQAGLAGQKTQAEISHLGGQTEKDKATASKTQADTKYEAATRHAQGVLNVQTPQDVIAYIDSGIKTGVFPTDQRDQMLMNAGKYPSIQDWVKAQQQGAVPVLDRLKMEAENSRNAATIAGREKTTKMSNETAIATNAASNARMAADAAAGRAVTMRGQSLADARSKETNEIQRTAQRTQIIETPDGPRVVDKGTGISSPVMDKGTSQPVAGDQALKRKAGATRVLSLLDDAEAAIKNATNSYLGAGADQAARLVGAAPKGAVAIGKLKAIEGALLAEMPRMEGPQSNYDVQNYKQAVANLGDPTVPNEIKSAAIATVREIQNRYAGNPVKPKIDSKALRSQADAILRGG